MSAILSSLLSVLRMISVSQNTIKICSFDVFDTVLTRVFARPSDLFTVLIASRQNDEKIESLSIAPETFACYRSAAEAQARQVVSTEEVTLEMIYAILGEMLGLKEAQWRALMRQEIEIEKCSVRPVPSALAAIRQARAEGKRVIFVSDMYLPAEVVQFMLETCGAFQPGDHLYISSQVGKTKATGNLFRYSLQRENVRPVQVQHMGDNAFADLERARMIGIKAVHFTETRLTRYEQTVADATEISSIPLRSLLAGKSRLTRLECPYEDEHRRVIWATGANVAGPILTGYVAWLLSDACTRGIERLYFLSRDGQILLRIAEIVRQKLDLPIECRYLYASRQAWRLPAIMDTLGDLEYDWILAPTDFLSVESVLKRVNLAPSDIKTALMKSGLPPNSWTRHLNPLEQERLGRLIRSGNLDALILQKAEERRPAAIAYLMQEGLLDDVHYAIVDLGWGGTLQRSLRKLLEACGDLRPTEGYYFGLLSRSEIRAQDHLWAYFWDYSQPSEWYDWAFMTRGILEVFTAADHGSVSHYEIHDGQVLPILMADTNTAALAWGLHVQQMAITRLAEELDPEILQDFNSRCTWPAVFARLLSLFYQHPTRAEAQVYAQFVVSEDQNESTLQLLARPYGVETALRALRGQAIYHHHNEWDQAAAVLTPRPLYYSIRLIQRANQWLFGKIPAR
jgi:predicted HAD superfamily hydrolase